MVILCWSSPCGESIPRCTTVL